MSDQEKEILTLLVKAHNCFLALPVQHPMDVSEWVSSLHELQRIIMARKAVRDQPDLFLNVNYKTK